MKTRLLKILRRDAEKRISIEYRKYYDEYPGAFIVMNGKEVVFCKYGLSSFMKERMMQEAFKFANKLRRAYIIEKLEELKEL